MSTPTVQRNRRSASLVCLLLAWLQPSSVQAWSYSASPVQSFTAVRQTNRAPRRRVVVQAEGKSFADDEAFVESIIQQALGSSAERRRQQQQQHQRTTRRQHHQISMPSQPDIVLASTTAADPYAALLDQEVGGDNFDSFQSESLTENTVQGADGLYESPATEGEDPFANDAFAQQQQLSQVKALTSKVESQKGPSIEQRLKSMDLSDIVATFIIPSIACYAAGKWAWGRVSTRMEESTETQLSSFAREMMYHDGNERELALCFSEYSRKLLVLLGPSTTNRLLQYYLQDYAKRKTVSPLAIQSWTFVFYELAKLTDMQIAKLLNQVAKNLGAEKISTTGKLLFIGTRVLKLRGADASVMAELEPIKTLIKSTYRDVNAAESMVETSQQAMAEASYRATVQAAGKNQEQLTPGWNLLGISKDVAQGIFKDQAEQGFVSDRETMYGMQTQKYDKKGRRINADGELEDPSEKDDDDDDDSSDGPISNVYGCTQCGYTLFIANGRESKFFGPGFACPECGAPKDKFVAKDNLDG